MNERDGVRLLALAGLDERLDRLLLTSTDNDRFVLSTESAKNIVCIVREWLRAAHARCDVEPVALRERIQELEAAVFEWKSRCIQSDDIVREMQAHMDAAFSPSSNGKPATENEG